VIKGENTWELFWAGERAAMAREGGETGEKSKGGESVFYAVRKSSGLQQKVKKKEAEGNSQKGAAVRRITQGEE